MIVWPSSRSETNVKDTLTFITFQVNFFIPWHRLGLYTSKVDILGLFPLGHRQLIFFIIGVDYFKKRREAKAIVSQSGMWNEDVFRCHLSINVDTRFLYIFVKLVLYVGVGWKYTSWRSSTSLNFMNEERVQGYIYDTSSLKSHIS